MSCTLSLHGLGHFMQSCVHRIYVCLNRSVGVGIAFAFTKVSHRYITYKICITKPERANMHAPFVIRSGRLKHRFLSVASKLWGHLHFLW